MIIIPIESGPVETIGYLVYDTQTKDCLIIDIPLESTNRFIDHITQLQLNPKAILLTHSHWDHSAEAPELRRRLHTEIYLHQADEYRTIEPMRHKIWQLPFDLEPFKPDKYLFDNTSLKFGSLECRCLHTPGHTEGGMCFLFKSENALFSGDTLFNMSIGRIDLPGGDYDTLINSIHQKLMTLNDDCEVHPGHGSSTTIGFERKFNTFLQ